MTKEDIFLIGDVVMAAAALGAITFTISYAIFFHWRKTAAGRSLMYFVLALDLWAVQSFIARLMPEYVGWEWQRLGIYLLINVAIWRLVGTLWWSWRRTPFEVERRKLDRTIEKTKEKP